MKRITTRDVAAEAKVSLATVDRVINSRPGVSPKTVSRINTAIEKLGFVRDMNAVNLVKGRVYRIRFILPDYDNDFIDQLQNEIHALKSSEELNRTTVDIQTISPLDSKALVAALDKVSAQDYCGVAFVAHDNPVVADAVKRLKDRGIVAVTIVSDVKSSAVDHFVGINNIAAGRLAASLLGRFITPNNIGGVAQNNKQKIAIVAGSIKLADHVQRRMGFEQVISSEFPQLGILPVVEGNDDNVTTQSLLDKLFDMHPDIVGLYSLGAAKVGVKASLNKRKHSSNIITIVHDLTDVTRAGILDNTFDAVINQDPAHQARSAVRVIKAISDKLPINHSKERIRIDVYMRDNLPEITI